MKGLQIVAEVRTSAHAHPRDRVDGACLQDARATYRVCA